MIFLKCETEISYYTTKKNEKNILEALRTFCAQKNVSLSFSSSLFERKIIWISISGDTEVMRQWQDFYTASPDIEKEEQGEQQTKEGMISFSLKLKDRQKFNQMADRIWSLLSTHSDWIFEKSFWQKRICIKALYVEREAFLEEIEKIKNLL